MLKRGIIYQIFIVKGERSGFASSCGRCFRNEKASPVREPLFYGTALGYGFSSVLSGLLARVFDFPLKGGKKH